MLQNSVNQNILHSSYIIGSHIKSLHEVGHQGRVKLGDVYFKSAIQSKI
ncbi:hypothetical protein HOG21_06175 [bacterium]|nr:hypothetical protein [bacterium]